MVRRQMYHSLVNQGAELHEGINKFENIATKYNLAPDTAKHFRPLTSYGKGKGGYINLINELIINEIS